jgi:hypothetical protein
MKEPGNRQIGPSGRPTTAMHTVKKRQGWLLWLGVVLATVCLLTALIIVVW